MQLIGVTIIHVMIQLGNVRENLTTTGTTRDMSVVVMEVFIAVKTARPVLLVRKNVIKL